MLVAGVFLWMSSQVEAAPVQLPISPYHLTLGTHGRYLNKIEYTDSVQCFYYKSDGTPKSVRTFENLQPGLGGNLSVYDFTPQEVSSGGWVESKMVVNPTRYAWLYDKWDTDYRYIQVGYDDNGRLAYENGKKYYYDSEGRLESCYYDDDDNGGWYRESYSYSDGEVPYSKEVYKCGDWNDYLVNTYSYSEQSWNYDGKPVTISISKDYAYWATLELNWNGDKIISKTYTYADGSPQESIEYSYTDDWNLIQYIDYVYDSDRSIWVPKDKDVVKYGQPYSSEMVGYKWNDGTDGYLPGWEEYERLEMDYYGNIERIERLVPNWWGGESWGTVATFSYVDEVKELPDSEAVVIKNLQDSIRSFNPDNYYSTGGIMLLSQLNGVETNAAVVVDNGHIVEIDVMINYGGMRTAADWYASQYGCPNASVFKGLFTLPKLNSLSMAGMMMEGDINDLVEGVHHESLKSLSCSFNKLSGNIGKIPEHFPNLSYLDVSHNCFSTIFPPIPKSIGGNTGYQSIDKTVDIYLNSIDRKSLESELPQIFGDAKEFILTEAPWSAGGWWSVCLTPVGNGYTLIPSILSGERDIDARIIYTSRYGNVVKLYDKNRLYSIKARLYHMPGDSNFDGVADVADLQFTINCILKGITSSDYIASYYINGKLTEPLNYDAADIHSDKKLNVQDIVALVNILLETPVEEEPATSVRKVMAADKEIVYKGRIYKEGNEVILENQTPIAALSLKHSGEIDWVLDGTGLVVSTNDHGVVAYSLENAVIPAGSHVIGYCSDDASILNASAADVDACRINLNISGSLTGIEALEKDLIDEEAVIFGIDGVRRNRLQPGMNIIVTKDKTYKVNY